MSSRSRLRRRQAYAKDGPKRRKLARVGDDHHFWLTWFRVVGFEAGSTNRVAYELRHVSYPSEEDTPDPRHLTHPSSRVQVPLSQAFPWPANQWQLLTHIRGHHPPLTGFGGDGPEPQVGLHQTARMKILYEVWHTLLSPIYQSSYEKAGLEAEELKEYLRVYTHPRLRDFEMAPKSTPVPNQRQRHELGASQARGDGRCQHSRLGAVRELNNAYWLVWFRIVGYQPGILHRSIAYELCLRPYHNADAVPASPSPPGPSIHAATSLRYPEPYTKWQLLTHIHRASPSSEIALSHAGVPLGPVERQELYDAVRTELANGWASPKSAPVPSYGLDYTPKFHQELAALRRLLAQYRCPLAHEVREPTTPSSPPHRGPSSPGRSGLDELRWGGPSSSGSDTLRIAAPSRSQAEEIAIDLLRARIEAFGQRYKYAIP